MKTRHEIYIDRIIAKPVAYLLNFLVRLMGQVLHIDHSLNKPIKCIVICKFKGMGSIIQSTPMIAAMRANFPESELIFVSTKSNEKLLRLIKHINTVVCINDSNFLALLNSSIRAWFILFKKRPTVYIDLEIYSNFSTLFTLFSLSKNRIGFYLRSSSFRMGIYTHMMFFNSKVPVSDVYLQIARLFKPIDNKPDLYPLYENCKEVVNFYEDNYIVINPNASDLRVERRWDSNNYTKLIKTILISYPDYKILLIGSSSEYIYTQTIKNEIKDDRLLNIAGKTSIEELICVIRNARMVITNDTGPMHIAFACQTPTLCLFGPCSPEQYAIFGNSHIIYKKAYCSPCVHDFEVPPCRGNNVCMKLITIEEVFSMTSCILNRNQCQSGISELIQYTSNNQTLGIVNRINEYKKRAG
ncbi:MAG: glycosyltransferase family 9 protein [Bacteroidales bacterium]|nr:glycosyltransferase family 9 protein [Bacteroidales bacterium]